MVVSTCVRSTFLFILATLTVVQLAAVTEASGDTWNPLEAPSRIEADSALNLSFLNHAPAGKWGFVRIDDNGDYYFEGRPDEKVVFYGPNLVGGCAVDLRKDQAEMLADRLAAMGYNVVRLHAVDLITYYSQGIFNFPTSTQVTLNSQKIDNLDYLIAKLKERGIYVTIDVMVSIPLGFVPGLRDYGAESGCMLVLFPEGMQVWKSMARAWLCHVNPYTGLALKDDPVLVGVSPWNEDAVYNMTLRTPQLREWLVQDFNAFLQAKGRPCVDTLANSIWDEPSSVRNSLIEYYTDKTIAAYCEAKDYLVNELGVKAPIGGFNYINSAYVTMWRTYADVHETHLYNGLIELTDRETVRYYPGSHPRYTTVFAPESKEDFVSRFSATIYTQYIPGLALTQLYRKPFMLSEYTQEFPTKGREDVGLMVAAVGRYHGWDMLNRFSWGSSASDAVGGMRLGASGTFAFSCDDLVIYSEIQGTLAFRRGGLTEASPKFVIVRNRHYAKTHENSLYNLSSEANLTFLSHLFKTVVVYVDKPLDGLQAIYKITSDLTAEDISSGNIPEERRIRIDQSMTLEEVARVFIDSLDDESLRQRMLQELDNHRLMSDTGELIFDLNLYTYMMNTPYMVGVVGTLDDNEFVLGRAALKASIEKGTVTASSLDGRPLDESTRILMIYTTDVAASSENYAPDPTDSRRVIYTRGTLPTLIKYATAEFSLVTSRDPQSYAAYKLDVNGRRVEALPVRVDGDRITVHLETDAGFAFELVAESTDR